jgi:hypothetical protein
MQLTALPLSLSHPRTLTHQPTNTSAQLEWGEKHCRDAVPEPVHQRQPRRGGHVSTSRRGHHGRR